MRLYTIKLVKLHIMVCLVFSGMLINNLMRPELLQATGWIANWLGNICRFLYVIMNKIRYIKWIRLSLALVHNSPYFPLKAIDCWKSVAYKIDSSPKKMRLLCTHHPHVALNLNDLLSSVAHKVMCILCFLGAFSLCFCNVKKKKQAQCSGYPFYWTLSH